MFEIIQVVQDRTKQSPLADIQWSIEGGSKGFSHTVKLRVSAYLGDQRWMNVKLISEPELNSLSLPVWRDIVDCVFAEVERAVALATT